MAFKHAVNVDIARLVINIYESNTAFKNNTEKVIKKSAENVPVKSVLLSTC